MTILDLDRVQKRLSRLRDRAKSKRVPFNVSSGCLTQIMRETACPACHKSYTKTPNSNRYLTIDRIIPQCGYIDRNIVGLCSTCNGLKEDKLPLELKLVPEKAYLAAWIEEECARRGLPIPDPNMPKTIWQRLSHRLIYVGEKIVRLGVYLKNFP